MKTKVWYVIWGLKDGGAETLVREYAKLLDKNVFDPVIVTMYPFKKTANYRRAEEDGLQIKSIFKRRNILTRAIRAFIGNWYIPMRLKGMLRKEKPDVIHFNSQMALYFTNLQTALSQTRLFYTCHSEVNKHFFEKEETATRQLVEKNQMQLIGLHEDMRKELDERFAVNNTIVIRNGRDLNALRNPVQSSEQVRKSIGIPEDAFIVGHVGRFSQVKNHSFLLKVFHKMSTVKNNAHLLLIGSGELQKQVEEELKGLNLEGRTTILSHRTDIPELLSAMDVMVFPSFYEGLSLTLVEAQAAGLRCIVSDSVNEANFLTEDTIPVSLNLSAEEWAKIALDESVKNLRHGDLQQYDLENEIRRLEQFYLQ